MNPLNQYILDKSKKLNIDICGFTDSSPLYNLREYLIYREENNIMTEFEEKDIMKRIDPKLTLPSCKSIIVIGVSYNVDSQEEAKESTVSNRHLTPFPKGYLSRASWGRDYHLVLREKMQALILEIQKVKDFNYRYFVDTGPLIDRELAKRAGIGYYGKNCSIINNEYGSFIFIGYILTDLDLDYSEEMENNCGDCNLCIKACPTGALEGEYKFNPKKCISYLTQTKENIPLDLRKKMGAKIYGCDTCQLVCPKNKGIKKPNHKEFSPEITSGYINIEELLMISNKEFKSKYGSMAGAWRGKNILRRNGIITLGNMKRVEHLNLLISQLKDPNDMIREYAQWAIVNIFLTILS